MVIMATDFGRRRLGTTTAVTIFSKNEREIEEEVRARINRDRRSQEDRERELVRLKERRGNWY